MSFSKRFQVFQEDSLEENEMNIYFEDFLNLLKKIDKDVIVDIYKVKQTPKRYKGGTKIFYDKQIVSVVSVLRFIFSYFDKYNNYAILTDFKNATLG